MKNQYIYGVIAIVAAAIVVAYFSIGNPYNNAQMKAEADSLTRASMMALNVDSFAKAYHCLSEAQTIYNAIDDKAGQMTVKANMAIVYYGLELYEDAKREIDIVEKNVNLIDTTRQVIFYRIKAIVETIVEKNYNKAIESMQKAIAIDRAMDSKISAMQDMANLAEIYIYNQQNDKAKQTIVEIEKMDTIAPDDYSSQFYFCKGKLYFTEQDYDQAYQVLQRCLDYSTRFNQPHLRLQALDILCSIDSLRDDKANYINNIKSRISLNDSLSGSRITHQIARLQEQQRIEIEHKNIDKQRTLLTVYIFAGFIIAAMLALIFFMLYRQTKARNRVVKLEAEKLDSEIILERMQNELLRLKVNQNDEELKEARKENLAMSLQLASLKDDDASGELQTFDDTFRKLNESFGNQLRERYPNLTNNEQRFLCLIKLGMTSSEMMSVLNVSQSGIYKMRYRLKKKLNLRGDETIEKLLATID